MASKDPGDIGYEAGLEQHRDKRYGPLRATVVDNKDPQTRGRIRVFIPALMTGRQQDETQWTDWVMPRVPIAGVSSTGAMLVPDIGSNVWIEYEMGHTDFATYSGGFYTTEGQPPPALARGGSDSTVDPGVTVSGVTVSGSDAGSSTYPLNRMVKTAAGIVVELDDTGPRVRARNGTGAFVEMQSDGDMVVKAPGNVEVGSNADVLIAAEGMLIAASALGVDISSVVNIDVLATALLNLQGATVNVTGSAAVSVSAPSVSIGASPPGPSYQPALKSVTYLTALGVWLSAFNTKLAAEGVWVAAVAAATPTLATAAATYGAALTNMATATNTFVSALATSTSLTVFTE